MADPTTANILLAVPTRGSDVGAWDTPVNNDFSAIDGFQGGIQIISVSNAPVTLTAPAGTVTASAGPTQSQNGVIVFTGTLTANVQVTFPLPSYYIISNQTTGNFILSFRAVGSGNVIAIDQGEVQHCYNDGTNVAFANLGRIGGLEIWVGYTAIPAWVTSCTVPPYLLCDGTVYNISAYPVIGKRFGSAFGGNGLTTFGVPDLSGRVPLPYDKTGTRITTAGCGLNGQTIGAAQDEQTVVIARTALPNVTLPYSGTATSTSTGIVVNGFPIGPAGSGPGAPPVGGNVIGNLSSTYSGVTASLNGGVAQTGNPNVQPSIVTGIAVVRAA